MQKENIADQVTRLWSYFDRSSSDYRINVGAMSEKDHLELYGLTMYGLYGHNTTPRPAPDFWQSIFGGFNYYS